MKRISRFIGRHLEGDAQPAFSSPTPGGTIHLERTDEALGAQSGLVAYSAFVNKPGRIADQADRFPGERISPNAWPVSDVWHGFQLNCLCEGRRFAAAPWPLGEGRPTAGLERIAQRRVKLQGWSRERRVVFVRTRKPLNAGPQDEFWAIPEEEVVAYGTNLEEEEAAAEQGGRPARKRADTENGPAAGGRRS